MTPDTAPQLARYFSTTPEFWLGIQSRYDIETARGLTGEEIKTIEPREAV